MSRTTECIGHEIIVGWRYRKAIRQFLDSYKICYDETWGIMCSTFFTCDMSPEVQKLLLEYAQTLDERSNKNKVGSCNHRGS